MGASTVRVGIEAQPIKAGAPSANKASVQRRFNWWGSSGNFSMALLLKVLEGGAGDGDMSADVADNGIAIVDADLGVGFLLRELSANLRMLTAFSEMKRDAAPKHASDAKDENDREDRPFPTP